MRISKKRPWRLGAGMVVALFTTMVFIQLSFEGGLTRFAGFGETFAPRYIPLIGQMHAYIKPGSGGYDGQFYAQLATDPTLQHPEVFKNAIDEPAYRSRRILLPLVAHAVALGNPKASILIYCSFNIFLWYLFALFIGRWLEVDDARGFAKWVACILSMGVMDSVKYSLTDLPSIFLMLIIIRQLQHRNATEATRPHLIAGAFVASLFLKETNLLSMAAIPKLDGAFRTWWKPMFYWVVTSILGILLFYAWYRYISLRFDPFHGISGNFDWPLVSMGRNLMQALRELGNGNWDDRYLFRLLSVVGFWVQLIYLISRVSAFRNPLVRMGLVYGFMFLFLGDLVWWGYWAVCRVALPMTIAFNLLYAPRDAKIFWIGIVLANLTVIHSVYRFL